MNWRAMLLGLSVLSAALAAALPAQAQRAEAPETDAVKIAIERPGDREFVRDLAGLLSPADKAKIQEIAGKLLTDKATPVIVVTIDSMAKFGGSGMRIETFARLLFDQWGVGVEKLNGESWNTGILLLVSKGDRKARIELGAHWRREQDQQCQEIMDRQIIPHFKQGDFSGGVLAGVESLDKLARGNLQMPSSAQGAPHEAQPMTGMQIALMIGAAALLVFTVVSLVRSGTGGWGWLLWAAVFGLIGFLLYQFISGAANSRGSSGGGYSGGSFGGGFSGGGGASGSW